MGSISYNGPELVVSGNAGNITYTMGAQEALKATVTNSSGTYTFTLKAYNDNTARTINLAEILNALPLNIPSPARYDTSVLTYKPSVVTIATMNGSTVTSSISIQVIRGLVSDRFKSASDAKSALSLKPHSVRPQVRYTYAGMIENLSVMVPWGVLASPAANTPTITYNATIYLGSGRTISVSWYTTLQACDYRIVTTRVDLDTILDEHATGPISEATRRMVTGWDVSVVISEPSTSSHTLKTVRYILKDGKAKTTNFAFVNDFGGIDTIQAVGSIKTVSSYSPSLFVNNDYLETIKTNQETEYEANTGPMDSAQEREAWLAFLRSPDKWIFEQSSSAFRRINLKDASPELEHSELNDITFKFSMESEKGGAVPAYVALEQM